MNILNSLPKSNNIGQELAGTKPSRSRSHVKGDSSENKFSDNLKQASQERSKKDAEKSSAADSKNALRSAAKKKSDNLNQNQSERKPLNSRSDQDVKKPRLDNKANVETKAQSQERPNELNSKQEKDPNGYNDIKQNNFTDYSNKIADGSKTSKLDKVVQEDLSNQINLQNLSDRLDNLSEVSENIVDPLSRRGAIQSFMKKMKDQFGVSPIELTKAFSKLSNEELALPADQTVEKVVGQLDLSNSQKIEATNFFRKMIQDSSAENMASYLKGSNRQLSLEVMTKGESAKQENNKNLKTLNNSFFMKDSVKPEAQAKSAELLQNENVIKFTNPVSQTKTSSNQKANSGLDVMSSSVFNPESAEGMVSSQGLEQKMMGMQSQKLSAQQAPVQAERYALNDLNAQLSQKMLTDQVAPTSLNPVAEGAGQSIENLNMNEMSQGLNLTGDSKEINLKSGAQFSDSMDSEGEAAAEEFIAPQDKSVTKDMAKGIKSEEFTIGKTEMTEKEEAENITNLNREAKILAKKGGGEMKVRLTPDGMGEIDLKVKVTEGKVNVEMLTENNHAKKLIEKGLGDLKAVLNSHKLDVQAIKVDVSNDLTEHFKDQQQEQERNFAQQFLQDFRRNNQNFRNSYGLGSDRHKNSQIEDQAANGAIKPSERRSINSDKRLDLVA